MRWLQNTIKRLKVEVEVEVEVEINRVNQTPLTANSKLQTHNIKKRIKI
jgi:hypothetical protein